MSPLAYAPPTMRLFDPDLPMLAAQAAIELDNLRLGRWIGLDTVHAIAPRLRTSFEVSDGSGRRAVIDSSSFAIVGRALDCAEWSGPNKTTDELIEKAAEMADAMQCAAEDTDREVVEKMRNFCVALSKSAAAYRQSLHDLAPAHPFRR